MITVKAVEDQAGSPGGRQRPLSFNLLSSIHARTHASSSLPSTTSHLQRISFRSIALESKICLCCQIVFGHLMYC